jgi:hypothetical protein
VRRGPLIRILAAATAAALVSSCAVRTDQLARDPGTVRMALNGWVGYEASAEVLAYILREEMDYQVQLVRVDEQPSWQAIDQGVIDVIVENWGHEDLHDAAEVCLALIAEHAAKIDGVKLSLLDREREVRFRARLPEGVRLYTGDDFNYPELIAGDGTRHSDALLGIFDVIAPAA